jgi:hypothetical protein
MAPSAMRYALCALRFPCKRHAPCAYRFAIWDCQLPLRARCPSLRVGFRPGGLSSPEGDTSGSETGPAAAAPCPLPAGSTGVGLLYTGWGEAAK